MCKTKLIATLGPSTSSKEKIRELILNGVSIIRLNTSHGDIIEHSQKINIIQELKKELNSDIKILIDLQGPKIRVDNLLHPINIKKNQTIYLYNSTPSIEKPEYIYIDYDISQDVKSGDKILINDGKVGLIIESVENKIIKTKVLYGDKIESRKGINIPTKQSSMKAITRRDETFIDMAISFDIDYIALSFVRSAEDIKLLKQRLIGNDIKIIAKIEKPQAVQNIDEILKESDGIMVARGDLGIEMPLEELPQIQKSLVKRAVFNRKFCIVATQMLESMVNNPIPTRAEVSDVANALYDGAHAIMLSAETSVGKYPIEAVKMMKKISKHTEKYIFPY